jgi:hypothetical protein
LTSNEEQNGVQVEVVANDIDWNDCSLIWGQPLLNVSMNSGPMIVIS